MLLVKTFDRRRDAWAFMILCDELEIPAGFPEPLWIEDGGYRYTVKYLI